jgi:hypothetical protein
MNLFQREAGTGPDVARCAGLAAAAGQESPWTAARAGTAAQGLAATTVLAVLLAGCASPGPPRSPSLRLPEPVNDLTARRIGDDVELRFTAPWQSTDKLPLRVGTLRGVLCRAVEHQPCLPVTGFGQQNGVATAGLNGDHNVVAWHDALPVALTSGAPRLISYRVEFFNRSGHSAGQSAAAYSAAGTAPAAVQNLRAEGSRLGVVLSWKPAPNTPGAVLLERDDLAPAAALVPAAAAKPASATSGRGVRPPGRAGGGPAAKIVWLEASAKPADEAEPAPEAGNSNPGPTADPQASAEMLDTSAAPNVPYRYTAVRRVAVSLGGPAGGRLVELRSQPSAPIEFLLREVYAPQAPTGLTAVGYSTAASSTAAGQPPAGDAPAQGYAVDLIWQPIDAAGLIVPLAGYNVYREAVSAAGQPPRAPGPKRRLNAQPVALPAFRDATADLTLAYRYSVTAVDSRGNESAAATAVLQPSQQP